MTANQIRYWDMRRQAAADQEVARSNKVKERETHRSNVQNEALKLLENSWRSGQALSQEANRWVKTPSEISNNRAGLIKGIGGIVTSIFK